ncbi:MAG TPA: DUF4976 domain-containing protein [Nitrospirae bacterium]|nr:arylsulfatase [bacterium BMS3Abin06]HDH12084.1 DUF4976 domain-containing protein [Nitrospirota bacterium]HDZ02229.1 DUF4976 domain-containing protein [Nitrospirota bacterium]
MTSIITSYWKVFRLIFVMFFLYLMGDAFFRWDGFSYYATFSEFLPAVALVSILWSAVALFTAMVIWLGGSLLEWLCRRTGWKIRIEHLLLFISVFAVLGALAWTGKRIIWQRLPTTPQLKLTIFLAVTVTSLFLTWIFRSKTAALQERITPLVWLFGIWVIISVPLVAYQTWGRQADTTDAASREISAPSVADSSRPNIILVIFDTLTALDMSVYGYERPTTPFISEWAETASVFTRTEADSNFTTPTTTAFMTGKRSWTHQTYHIDGSKPVKNYTENLPLVLKENGYYNMAFVVNPYASPETLGISGGFEIADPPVAFYVSSNNLPEIIWAALYRLFGDKIRLHDWIVKEDFILYRVLEAVSLNVSETTVPPEKAFNRFLDVLDNKPPEPFFAWFQVLPPHDPYLPPKPYMGMFDPSFEMRSLKSQRRAPLHEFKADEQPKADIIRARYDEFIRYCDKQFEDLITQLKKRDKLKNTVIIFSSDHGESFEHNFAGHGGPHLYEQLTHVPFIIKEPGQKEGQLINLMVEQIDIPYTILDLIGVSAPSWMEGRSLVPLLRGKKIPSRPVFSMNFQKNRSLSHPITRGTIAVHDGDYKLIHYLEKEETLLFNLKEDPDELNNLFDREPETGQRLLNLLQENLKKANDKISQKE